MAAVRIPLISMLAFETLPKYIPIPKSMAIATVMVMKIAIVDCWIKIMGRVRARATKMGTEKFVIPTMNWPVLEAL